MFINAFWLPLYHYIDKYGIKYILKKRNIHDSEWKAIDQSYICTAVSGT